MVNVVGAAHALFTNKYDRSSEDAKAKIKNEGSRFINFIMASKWFAVKLVTLTTLTKIRYSV